MSKITKKQFLADVMHEINALRQHASIVEKGRLNFNYFDPNSKLNCLYGQMTGSCKSARASELIDLCCIRVVINDGELDSFADILPKVNGAYNRFEFENGRRYIDLLSSLEGYIMADTAKNEKVIQYIKGETDNLTL